MLLVVGLGNPGRDYEETRHNLGVMVVDTLREAAGWPDYRSRFSALWTRGEVESVPVVLLKPQTFMNASGQSVQPAAAFLRIPPSAIIVVHDELDLPWREVRLKVGGGHAGHNGLRSIIERIGADFVRVRVGIGKPGARRVGASAGGPDRERREGRQPHEPGERDERDEAGERGNEAPRAISDWVLSRFDARERAELPEVCAAAVAALRGAIATIAPRAP